MIFFHIVSIFIIQLNICGSISVRVYTVIKFIHLEPPTVLLHVLTNI